MDFYNFYVQNTLPILLSLYSFVPSAPGGGKDGLFSILYILNIYIIYEW